MLSMPRGTDPLAVLRAAKEFAGVELDGHKYLMVLHDHQANPHVHISVRAEGRNGQRLNPRKADLQRWRETFAAKLREMGIDAEATRQITRGVVRDDGAIWRIKARESGRLRRDLARTKTSPRNLANRASAIEAWNHLRTALESSPEGGDTRIATAIGDMLGRITSRHERARDDVSRKLTVPER